jgi:adenylylsulfate kinase
MSGVIWITGLPGVGKTEVAKTVLAQLRRDGRPCVLLDGDQLRNALAPLIEGYDVSSRRRLAHAYANVAALVAAQDTTCVVATVSLFADVHARNRSQSQPYLEVLLTCGEAERERRRPRANLGNAPQVGIDIVPEWPAAPDLVLDSESLAINEIAARVLAHWHALADAR